MGRVVKVWKYENHSEQDYIKALKRVEGIAQKLGAVYVKTKKEKYTTYIGEEIVNEVLDENIYMYKDQYFRVERFHTDSCPFIVLSFGDTEDTTFEDADPFPYNLPDEELVNEVKYSLGIEPYPKKKPTVKEVIRKSADIIFKGFVIFCGIALIILLITFIIGGILGLNARI